MSTQTPRRGVTPGLPTNNGSFKADERAEANVSLGRQEYGVAGVPIEGPTDPYRPMTAAEFRQWSAAAQELRLLDLDDHTTTLIDGSKVKIIPASDDFSDGCVVGSIIERGEFHVLRPDGSFTIAHFDDPTQRGQFGDRIAQNAVLALRGEGAHLGIEDGQPIAPPQADERDPNADIKAEIRARLAHLAPPTDEDLATEHRGAQTEAAAEKRFVDAPDSFWHGAEIIHTYTRKQALEDGALVPYGDMAKEAGISWPVDLTAAAQADAVSWNDSNAGLQDEEGRAWDVINMAAFALRRKKAAGATDLRVGERIPFVVARVPNTPRATMPRNTTLHLVLGHDDNGQPCWTVMKPDED